MLDWIKIGAGILVGAAIMYLPAYLAGKEEGRQLERVAVLNRSVEILRERTQTDDQIRNMDSGSLCATLGGRFVPDDGTCQ